MSKKKHRSKKRKKLNLKRNQSHQKQPISLQEAPLAKTTKKTENQAEKNKEELLPLTYPPHVLKKDLLKTLIITLIILALELSLYYYDKSHNLVNLLKSIHQ